MKKAQEQNINGQAELRVQMEQSLQEICSKNSINTPESLISYIQNYIGSPNPSLKHIVHVDVDIPDYLSNCYPLRELFEDRNILIELKRGANYKKRWAEISGMEADELKSVAFIGAKEARDKAIEAHNKVSDMDVYKLIDLFGDGSDAHLNSVLNSLSNEELDEKEKILQKYQDKQSNYQVDYSKAMHNAIDRSLYKERSKGTGRGTGNGTGTDRDTGRYKTNQSKDDPMLRYTNSKELVAELKSKIDEQPEKKRDRYSALVDLLSEGWSQKEIAEYLGVTEGAISQNKETLRKMIYELLHPPKAAPKAETKAE